MQVEFRNRVGFVVLALVLMISLPGKAQDVENVFQPRLNVELEYEPIKNLELSFSPEIRFEDNFSADVYVFDLGASYKLWKGVKVEGIYRYGINLRETKSTEYYQRYAFGVIGKTKWNNFEPYLRLRYTNDNDDNISNDQMIRLKAGVKYDIPNCKISPLVAVEGFHSLDENSLYKLRYALGAKYKLCKNQYLKAYYKFDYYNLEYKNRHIISVGYNIKF